MKILFIILFLLSTLAKLNGAADYTKCRRDYKKMGCLKDTRMTLLISDRKHVEHMLDWNHFAESIHNLACRCAEEARKGGYMYFSIRYWAECWAGKSISEMKSILSNPRHKTSECFTKDFKKCDDNGEWECVGKAYTGYIYSLEDIDGGYTEWSEFTNCSTPCDNSTKSRVRECTQPVPQNRGKNCSTLGPSTETVSCNLRECPIDGGMSSWTSYSNCSEPCGSGYQKRSRSCITPKPKHGGKPCIALFGEEGRICNTQKCPGTTVPTGSSCCSSTARPTSQIICPPCGHCFCVWYKCNRMGLQKAECYARHRACARKQCDTTNCDKHMYWCRNAKSTEMTCAREWKVCFEYTCPNQIQDGCVF